MIVCKYIVLVLATEDDAVVNDANVGVASDRQWFWCIGGPKPSRIGFQVYEPPVGTGGKAYPNWLCYCPHHRRSCHTVRGVYRRSTLQFGLLEPIAWLHCWRDMPLDERGRHQKPTPEQVAEWVRIHGDAARDRFSSVIG